ncbi:MAG: hypothetical protein AAFY08_16195 [Planctomycetota bacterium]
MVGEAGEPEELAGGVECGVVQPSDAGWRVGVRGRGVGVEEGVDKVGVVVVAEDADDAVAGSEGGGEVVDEGPGGGDGAGAVGAAIHVVAGEGEQVDPDAGELADGAIDGALSDGEMGVGEVGDAQAFQGGGQAGVVEVHRLEQAVRQGHGVGKGRGDDAESWRRVMLEGCLVWLDS